MNGEDFFLIFFIKGERKENEFNLNYINFVFEFFIKILYLIV